jgi:hypothetical protein
VAQIDRAPSGDGFFFYPYIPTLPSLTGRRHVAAVDVMTPGYTTAEQFHDTCVRVVSDAQWVVLDRSWSDLDKLRSIFPAMRDPKPPRCVASKRRRKSPSTRLFIPRRSLSSGSGYGAPPPRSAIGWSDSGRAVSEDLVVSLTEWRRGDGFCARKGTFGTGAPSKCQGSMGTSALETCRP